MIKQISPKWPIIGGLLAALGASVCCAGPLILLLLGISGSWIGTLTAFDPLRPYFIIMVVALLFWAGWRLYRPIDQCQDGDVCAIPQKRKQFQIIYWPAVSLSLILVSSPYWILWFA